MFLRRLVILSKLFVIAFLFGAQGLTLYAQPLGTTLAANRQLQSNAKGTLTVGSRDFTEQLLLGQILVQALRTAGYEVIDQTGLGGTNSAHNAIIAGEVDIIWDYIGTILSESHNVPSNALPTEAEAAFALVADLDLKENNLVWLTPSAFNDTYTLMVSAERFDPAIQSIEDLAALLQAGETALKICVENEFYSRGDGLFSLQTHYNFAFAEENIEIVAYDQLYEGLRTGLCEVAEGFSTDGRIAAWGFRNLTDSLNFFPAYNASPIVRAEVIETSPDVRTLLDQLGPLLDNATITELNARIDIGADGVRSSGDEETVVDVAASFLQSVNLSAEPAPTDERSIAVGSRDFTEQLLLGQILVQSLQDAGFAVVDKTGLGGTNSAHDAIKSGEVDLIWDYIGTILSESHGLPAATLPTDAEIGYLMVGALDLRHHGLVWLAPSAFNDTYTLMVRNDDFDPAIGTMEQLADFMNNNGAPLKICVENEFYSRGDGLFSLQQHYNFAFAEEKIEIVGYDQLYEGLRTGLCEVAEGFSTDGRIAAWGFRNLADSLNFFPTYNASPIIRQATLERSPELKERLDQLGPLLDNETITELNARVDIGADGVRSSGDEESVAAVAYAFLRENRLVKLPTIVVGAKTGAGQRILGQILVLLLQDAGYTVEERIGLGDGATVQQALRDGAIDLYPELTGLALTSYHGLPATALPASAQRTYQLAKALDERRELTWLAPTAYNDATVLLGSQPLRDLGLVTLEDLARYMNENDAPLRICMDEEFYTRSFDSLQSVQTIYGFQFKEENILLMDRDSAYVNLQQGECEIAKGHAVDGRIAAWELTPLVDSLSAFSFANAAPVIRQEILAANPDLADRFAAAFAALDEAAMSRLEAQVELGPDNQPENGDEVDAQAVAREFLVGLGLVSEN